MKTDLFVDRYWAGLLFWKGSTCRVLVTLKSGTEISQGICNCKFSANLPQGRFPVIAEITRCHTFINEIHHASARCQYFNENFYCKNCLRVFFAMTGKPASVSFWPLLIIELVARTVPERLIILLMERQIRDQWNFLHHPLLRRLRSDLLNPKFGNQKSALLWLKSHNFSETLIGDN